MVFIGREEESFVKSFVHGEEWVIYFFLLKKYCICFGYNSFVIYMIQHIKYNINNLSQFYSLYDLPFHLENLWAGFNFDEVQFVRIFFSFTISSFCILRIFFLPKVKRLLSYILFYKRFNFHLCIYDLSQINVYDKCKVEVCFLMHVSNCHSTICWQGFPFVPFALVPYVVISWPWV
jgi:hypothetical protein